MSVKDTTVAILAQQAMLETDDIAMTHSLDDIGIDSLGIVETIFALEETFDITIPFNANDPSAGDFDISNVAAIVAAVERLVAAKGT